MIAGAGVLVVRVPQADRMVADLRQRWDASAALGMAAHVTVLFPFPHPDEHGDSDLQRRLQAALAAVPAFDFTLAAVRRFAQTAYLAPSRRCHSSS